MGKIFSLNHWKNRKTAFLGDSITDADHIGTTKNYWQFLEEILEIKPLVYGINGSTFVDIPVQAERLFNEHDSDVDAVIVFAGTNDYCSGTALGEWYTYSDAMVNSNGMEVIRRKRELIYDVNTFRGRINIAMKYLKEHFPYSQIILLTMLHRGNAEFSASNIQPAECYANACGFFADSYVEVIKEAGNIWAVPVIDLNSLSGLYPMLDVHGSYFSNIHTDRLHPEISGHKRIAETLVYQLLSLPATFR